MESDSSVLLTDLYQFTMLQGYFDRGMEETAVFEFFVRKLPPSRGFLMAAGLEQSLKYLERLHFTPRELEWLAGSGRFSRSFVDYLERLRFTGDVHAMPEGTLFFPQEPILRVTAPLPQAQLIETRLINLLHFQTLIASKAARFVLAAPGKLLVDFGLRRAHGAEAGLLAARAAYLAGFSGSATVLAELLFGVPAYGTMAHSFIQAHDDEWEAFINFARAQPNNVMLLLDTYDTEAAAEKVVALAPRLKSEGIRINGVRLDSGDLGDHARKVRRILDNGGLVDVKIFASGNLSEDRLRNLIETAAPIDGYGIGSDLVTSADAPHLDCAYKLQEYAGRARRKRSEGKATWPGRKQIFRRYGPDGRMREDLLTLDDRSEAGEPLIQAVMRAGRRLAPPAPLNELRAYAADQLAHLPEPFRGLRDVPPYPVKISDALTALANKVDAETRREKPR
ncbi:MAG TPA: nicotinate phosphoribosyltransferase [Nitrospiria bacterium]|nr:nicotinate phosphoribosyltransferase [Nitrospiria bacterium]